MRKLPGHARYLWRSDIRRLPGPFMLLPIDARGFSLAGGYRRASAASSCSRALLQKSRLTFMDECFAALDAATLVQCLDCAFKHAKTLRAMAHP